MFWTAPGLFRPGMDAMTYGALAKHVLETGDWARLHYSSGAYADFFQHPPLGIWMMALTFKIFGTADWVLKVLPSLFGAATVVGIYAWGFRIRGEWFAFVASFILLTSTRFAKFSRELMLDPFLAGFSVFALLALLFGIESKDSRKRAALTTIGGLLIGAAFLSKGLFAFAPLAAGIMILASHRKFKLLPFWLAGSILPVLLWFIFGGANEYLHRYYIEHVAGRVGHHSIEEHLEPIRNLTRVYWPWLPFFFYGGYRIIRVRGLAVLRSWEGAGLLAALGFLGGFCLVASFLEQYHTSFYPFAALVVAYPLTEGRIGAALNRARNGIVRGIAGIAAVVLVVAVVYPAGFTTGEYKNPIRIILKHAATDCHPATHRRILISDSVAEIWYALSTGTWNTPWDAVSGPVSLTPSTAKSDVLLAGAADTPAAGWEKTGIEESGLRIFALAGVYSGGG